MLKTWQRNGFGLYIHWPFCESKCPYCDFNSHVTQHVDHGAWKDAYLARLEQTAEKTQGRVLRSIFFGGGTPSLMDPSTVSDIIDAAARHWVLANDVEITLEANPSSVEANRFANFRSAGVNRVSLGIQALNDSDLIRLGRLHSAKDAFRAIEIAKNNFDRMSIDLIYARQDQTMAAWVDELDIALKLGLSHISLYTLTIEPGTVFAKRHSAGHLKGLPSEDLEADMYEYTEQACANAGLNRYEVSNFALPGEESVHNLVYWNSGDYLGVGPGAHGRLTDEAGTRWSFEEVRAPLKWLQGANTFSSYTQTELSREEHAHEIAVMGLRLSKGLDLTFLTEVTGMAVSQKGVERLSELGAIVISDNKLIVEKQWVGVLESILVELFSED